MIITLLVIYTLGLGNTAILTEKFITNQECEIVLKDIKETLGSKVEFSYCYK